MSAGPATRIGLQGVLTSRTEIFLAIPAPGYTPRMPTPVDSKRTNSILVIVGLLALTHLVLSRLAWSDIPLQTDTGIWAYFAGRMLEGARLYRDLWESKPPGIFLTFAGIERVFGVGGDRVLLWLDAVVTVAVCLVTYAVARRFAKRAPSTIAVSILSVVMCHRVLADWGDNLEKFVSLFEMTALWLLFSGTSGRRWFWIGLCCGLAAAFKQTGILLFGILVLGLIPGWREQGMIQQRGRALGLLILGAALPWLVIVFWLTTNGSIRDFWRQVVIHDLSRATMVEAERTEPLSWSHWSHVGQHLSLALVVFGPALAACMAYARRREKKDRERGRTGLGLIAVYAISATMVYVLAPNGYGHYLLQAAPPAAVLSAWVFSLGWNPRQRPFTMIVLSAGLAVGIWQLQDHVTFLLDPDYGPRRAYASIRDRKEALAIVVRGQCGPDEAVMLWPADHAVNYYARRRTPLEICQAIDIFGGRIRLLDPPLPEVLKHLQAMPPEAIVDWTPIHVVHVNPDDPKSPLAIQVQADGYSLVEAPNPHHERLEGRLLASLKEWIRREYGGQVRYDDRCTAYSRSAVWRDEWDYLRRDQIRPID